MFWRLGFARLCRNTHFHTGPENMPLRSHNDTSLTRLSALFGLLVSLLVVVGCSSEKPAEDMIKLTRLVDFQHQFAESHDGREPGSADELREWVKEKNPQELAERQITDVDSLFTSSRDGEPFVIVPREKGAVTSDQNRIVAYEQKGIDGLRLVAFDLGQVMEMDGELITHLQEDHVPE
jgi:hypothetical protein